MSEDRCSARVHDSFGVSFHPCLARARVTEEGKGWCMVHAPSRQRERARISTERWQARDREATKRREAAQRIIYENGWRDAVDALHSLDDHIGYEPDYDGEGNNRGWYCRGKRCGQPYAEPHLDGCEVAEMFSRGRPTPEAPHEQPE